MSRILNQDIKLPSFAECATPGTQTQAEFIADFYFGSVSMNEQATDDGASALPLPSWRLVIALSNARKVFLRYQVNGARSYQSACH